MSHSTLPDCEPNSASTVPEQPGELVVRKHHFLVRWSHWLNVPILLGLILSGISIYWASPVYQHKPDPNTGNVDVAADIGIWIRAHVKTNLGAHGVRRGKSSSGHARGSLKSSWKSRHKEAGRLHLCV
jgi:hypothetical protein